MSVPSRFCRSCGASSTTGATFCQSCGKPLDGARSSSGPGGVLIVLGVISVLALAVLVGVAAFRFMGDMNSTTTQVQSGSSSNQEATTLKAKVVKIDKLPPVTSGTRSWFVDVEFTNNGPATHSLGARLHFDDYSEVTLLPYTDLNNFRPKIAAGGHPLPAGTKTVGSYYGDDLTGTDTKKPTRLEFISDDAAANMEIPVVAP